VDLLDVQPEDQILDVGCGPGVTLELLAQRATAGLVAGVDPSEVMREQAARRTATAPGRVEVRAGTADALPYPDGSFTTVCALHSVYFWPALEAGLREIARVLAPGGRIVLVVRLRSAGAGPFAPARYGLTEDDVRHLMSALAATEFQEVRTARQNIGKEKICAILARR
jgi:ubiquinone/menaquinone biosynthesis C-methylase UbiE